MQYDLVQIALEVLIRIALTVLVMIALILVALILVALILVVLVLIVAENISFSSAAQLIFASRQKSYRDFLLTFLTITTIV